ncbi:hypothetical protein KEM52_006114 [Ascosphaera acerosa]|nr:hypothetical protein KEM52_006114 [Ascosphaera acerosa]
MAADRPKGTMVRFEKHAPMPRPRQAGAPYFTGTDVTRFIQEFQDLCNEFGLPTDVRLQKLPLYCEPLIGDNIAFSPDYIARDYDKVLQTLKDDYKRGDRSQTMYTPIYLQSLCEKVKNNPAYLKDFVRDYTTVSQALLAKQQIDEWTQCLKFVDHLPMPLGYNVRRDLKLDRMYPAKWKWNVILAKVKEEMSIGTAMIEPLGYGLTSHEAESRKNQQGLAWEKLAHNEPEFQRRELQKPNGYYGNASHRQNGSMGNTAQKNLAQHEPDFQQAHFKGYRESSTQPYESTKNELERQAKENA